MKIYLDVRFVWDDETWIFQVQDELQNEMYLAMLDNDTARYQKAELMMLERENNGEAL
jgi:hypothetical protein